jgi:hypothetical protein
MTKVNSNITWRKVTIDDYNNILLKWWSDWGWEQAPTLDMLPEGYIINKDGIDVYAGFIYYTGTTLAWVEYIISNKEATPQQRRGGLEKLIDVISIIAKHKGVNALFTSTTNQSFGNSLQKNGFVIGDTGNLQLIKKI